MAIINNISKKQHSNQDRGFGFSKLRFEVDTTYVKVLRTDSMSSYNFSMFRGRFQENVVENLVIEEYPRGVRAHILKYNLNREIEKSLVHDSYVVDAKLEIFEVDLSTGDISNKNNASECLPVVENLCYNNGTGQAGETHIAGANCYNETFLYTGLIFDCEASGGGDGTNTGGIIVIDNTSNYPPPPFNGGLEADHTISTNFTLSPKQQRRKHFFKNLDNEIKECLPTLPESEYGEVMDFLETFPGGLEFMGTVYPEEKSSFAEAVLAAKCDDNDVEVDYVYFIIEEFEDTNVDCIHDNFKPNQENGTNNNLYQKLISNFRSSTNNHLVLKVGNVGADWGQTSGNWTNSANNGNNDLLDFYEITISDQINQNGSNLALLVALTHELIHTYMFDTLSDAGFLTFDSITGEPIITSSELNQMNCNLGALPTNIILNDYSMAERFSILMCTMIYTGLAQNSDWSHSLFGNYNFSVNTYQQQLADFLLENHDWDSESNSFKNNAENIFGVDWKSEIAEAASWIGLESTNEYANYINQINNTIKQLYILDIQNKVFNAEYDCQ